MLNPSQIVRVVSSENLGSSQCLGFVRPKTWGPPNTSELNGLISQTSSNKTTTPCHREWLQQCCNSVAAPIGLVANICSVATFFLHEWQTVPRGAPLFLYVCCFNPTLVRNMLLAQISQSFCTALLV